MIWAWTDEMLSDGGSARPWYQLEFSHAPFSNKEGFEDYGYTNIR